MADKFDPYHRWLGVPSAEQPANHYRLLGLVPFEADPEVIRDAAERQMAHVRGYALGKNAKLSQKILNELGGAKACLMDSAKKAVYDRKLREAMPAAAEAERPPAPPATPPPLAATPMIVEPAPVRTVAPPKPQPVPSKAPLVIAGVAAAALLLVLVGVSLVVAVTALNRSKQEPPTNELVQKPDAKTQTSEKPKDNDNEPKPVEAVRGPQLGEIQPQTVDKGRRLQFTVPLKSPGSRQSRLLYELAPGKPPGAEIDPESGVFTFAPGEQQEAGVCLIRVRVVAPELGNLSDEKILRVTVNEVNRPPAIVRMSPVSIDSDRNFRVRIGASDPDEPRDKLTFSLVKKPEGAEIEPLSGQFTWRPTSQHAGGRCDVTVRVTDSGGLYDDMTFTISVNSLETAKPVVAAKDTDFRIALPSGKTLASDTFKQIRQSIRTDVEASFNQFVMGSYDVVVLWNDPAQTAMNAVANLKKSKLDGPSVGFHTGKDPVTCYRKALQEEMMSGGRTTYTGAAPSPSPSAPGVGSPTNPGTGPGTSPTPGPTGPGTYPRTSPIGTGRYPRPSPTTAKPKGTPTDFWNEVIPYLYVTYHREKWDKWLATWNEKGEKHYWCEHVQDKRNGLGCLFKDDRLAMVVEYESDKPTAIHLISANQVSKTFNDLSEAQSDSTAGALLREIDSAEQELKQNSIVFEKATKKQVQIRIGILSAMKGKAADARTRAIYEQQNQQFKAIAERARGG